MKKEKKPNDVIIDIYLNTIENLRLELKQHRMFIWTMIHSNGGKITIDDNSHAFVSDQSKIIVQRDGENRKTIYIAENENNNP